MTNRQMYSLDLTTRRPAAPHYYADDIKVTLMYSYEHIVGFRFEGRTDAPGLSDAPIVLFNFSDGEALTNTNRQHIHAFRVAWGQLDRDKAAALPHEGFVGLVETMVLNNFNLTTLPRITAGVATKR